MNIEAERWIKAPESDHDEGPLVAVLAECEEPSRQAACDDDSVEIKAPDVPTKGTCSDLVKYTE